MTILVSTFRMVCKCVAAISLVTGLATLQSARASDDAFIGEIQTFPYDFCPRGFAPLRGAMLPINQNQALFSLLGFSYGGNDVTTFALPLGRPPFTIDRKPLIQCIALQGVFPSRD